MLSNYNYYKIVKKQKIEILSSPSFQDDQVLHRTKLLQMELAFLYFLSNQTYIHTYKHIFLCMCERERFTFSAV